MNEQHPPQNRAGQRLILTHSAQQSWAAPNRCPPHVTNMLAMCLLGQGGV